MGAATSRPEQQPQQPAEKAAAPATGARPPTPGHPHSGAMILVASEAPTGAVSGLQTFLGAIGLCGGTRRPGVLECIVQA